MPIIIDANRASDFKSPAKNRAPEIYKKVSGGGARVVVGGLLLRELTEGGLGAMLLEWGRAGRLIRATDAAIEASLKKAIGCKSNDKHVVALAMATGTQLIYTDDILLIQDFKNTTYLSPKGRIIKSDTKEKVAKALLNNYGA